MKAVRKFITRASTARFEGGKRTAALTPFLQVRWQRFIKPIFSTPLSSMAMVRRHRRRKAARTSVSAGTRRSRVTRSSPSAIAIAMSSRRLFRRLAIAMNRRYCEKLCRWSRASPMLLALTFTEPSSAWMASTIAGLTAKPFSIAG